MELKLKYKHQLNKLMWDLQDQVKQHIRFTGDPECTRFCAIDLNLLKETI
jgi:hypothetical protein